MERNYVAFISYRHLPLEMSVAKMLHRRIERYGIPKELRKNGEKKVGLVFRDQDELPISSNLSDNIQQALDHSEYLIVICTPETSKSHWVLREISYFLENHDRDHVLAVLADGTPETSFPTQLTEVRSADGDLLSQIEPLAANIVADSAAKRKLLFQTESLRILAALIGCPFDALYRREQRFRRRRAALAFGVCALVAAAFIGMLLNRNAEIRAQLQRALVSESQTLASLSQNAYREGDYIGALRYALQALPGEDNERPYVAEAEYALSRELDLYRQGILSYSRSYDQESVITAFALSEDGQSLVTADEYGTLRCWDRESGTLRWEKQGASVLSLRCCESLDAVLCLAEDGASLLRCSDASLLWHREDVGLMDLAAFSVGDRTGLVTSYLWGGNAPETVSLIDVETGETLVSARLSDGVSRCCVASALSDDASCAAFLLQNARAYSADLYLWQVGRAEPSLIAAGLRFSPGTTAYQLLFTGENDLLLACDDRSGQSFVRLYARSSDWAVGFETPLETEKITLQSHGGASDYAGVDLFGCEAGCIAFGCKHDLYMLDLRGGEVLWHMSLPCFLLAGRMYPNACMGLVLGDGTVSFCTDQGILSSSLGVYAFEGRFYLTGAAIAGASYPESHALLIPEDHPNRAALIEFVDNEQMIPLGAFSSSVSHIGLIASPSGELVLAVGYDPTGSAVEAVLLDAVAGDSGRVFSPPSLGVWDDPGSLVLSDDGKLYSPGGVYDAVSLSDTSFLTTGSSLLYSAVDSASGRLFSAQLVQAEGGLFLREFLDGEETAETKCPAGEWSIAAVGGNGCTLLRSSDGVLVCRRASGEWVELDETSAPVCALGESEPLLAVWDGSSLLLRDLESGRETVAETELSMTAKLLFADGDALLLAFSETGELCVIRTEDGALLHRSQHASLSVRFRSEDARYSLANANDGRLLVFCDDLLSRKTVCLVLDRESWGCAGAYDDVGAYLPGRDSVLVCPDMDGIYLSHFRSRDEIVELARQLVGNAS